MWGSGGLRLGVGKVIEGTEAKERRGQDIETTVVHLTIKVNKNYGESGIETVTGISKLLLQIKEASSIV